MKFFKVITLAVLGFFLVNCDNSKTTVDDIKQKAEQTGSEIGDKANQMSSDAVDKVKQMSADVSDKAKEIGAEISDKVKQTSATISDKAKDLYEQTKSEKEDMLNKVQEGNYSVAENLMIKAIKTKLPATIDQNTTLVDVSTDNKTINYKYVVNNSTKDALQAEGNQKEVRNKLIEFYCSDDSNMKTLRLVFPRGANHDYYINDDKVFSVDVKPNDCDDD
ncbi:MULTISPECIES: YtxH domain-containing protein [unclassified Gilliamella]|uniref:YtxH domain-containing protein n=1 Tax=unclassified Gilliamella TaxID=2685620 RepID=UPI00080EB98E|nr:YtxH domain-containing protein [Gilliamella apicola]OCG18695.1 hypothetical protein A9G23_09815 [Gilliamella apicola]OCG24964.1 hypothetical protein A9G22_03280 [Gilliamella apicola]